MNNYSNMLLAAALAVGGFVAPVSIASASMQSTSGQDLTPNGRGAYLAVAGGHSLYEVRAAELALEKARSPEAREFAQMMLAEHRRLNERLTEVAQAVGLEAQMSPPAMLPMHWDLLRQLERRSGSRFDRAYLEQQVAMHEVAVALHSNFVTNGTDDRLKAFASEALPAVTRHLERARQLSR